MGTAIKHPVPDRVKTSRNFWHPGAQGWASEWQQWASKG